MTLSNSLRSKMPFHKGTLKHWESHRQMHQVMDSIPGYMRALLLELLQKPLSFDEISAVFDQFKRRFSGRHRQEFKKADISSLIKTCLEKGIIYESDGIFSLTPGGKEIAEHIQLVIPYFFDIVFSTKTVSLTSIVIHILLSILKLLFGFLSRSAGLISDGIDNTVDTISSFLVWLGIKYERERITSIFIIVTMIISGITVAFASINKILHPAPVEEGTLAFIISAFCGLLMFLLSSYQYVVGKRKNNFSIICQSIDSKNHVLTSLLVCGGIILSIMAERYDAFFLFYADGVASALIGIIIIKSVFELISEFHSDEGNEPHIPHFAQKAREQMRKKIIYEWIFKQLQEKPYSRAELSEAFRKDFCEVTPKIFEITEFGYNPKNCDDLYLYLDFFTKKMKFHYTEEKYFIGGITNH